MKGKLSKNILLAIVFGVLAYALGVVLVVFTQYDGNFDASALIDKIPLILLAVGLVGGFVAPFFKKGKNNNENPFKNGKRKSDFHL